MMQTKLAGGIRSSLYQPLAPDAVARVADEAFRILEKSGMAVHTATGREALRNAGADVDEETCVVKFPRSLVEDAIASNPSSVTLRSRDGRNDCVLEKNRVYYSTGGTALYVLDPKTGERRPSCVDDVILNARMVQDLENIHGFVINVFPNEIEDKEEIDVNRFFHALDNTTKHVMGGVYSLDGTKQVVEMARRIAGDEKALRERPFVSFITLIISPLTVDNHYGEITCYLAREGLPVVVPTEPICGTTSPVTLAGNVLMHTAETLGGIVLVQAVNKGAPGICGSVGSITNLQTMDHVGGAIERGMLNAAVAQIAQHFRLPFYSTAGTTDAKRVNVQASYESAMSSLLVAMSGANFIHDIAGLMEADLTVSYEKLVVDNEILGMCQRVLSGIEVTDEALAADLIIEKGPGGHYMAEPHTLTHMQGEFYMPELANRDKFAQFDEQDDALSRAKTVVERFVAATPEPLLEKSVRESILANCPGIRERKVQ